MKTIAERIKEGLELRNMKQADLVEKTGIGKSSISTYISGSYEPKQRNIYKIAQALNVNESWLMGYDVPMERNNIQTTTSDPDIRRIQRARNNMTTKEKEKMMNILRASFEDYFSDDYKDDDLDE